MNNLIYFNNRSVQFSSPSITSYSSECRKWFAISGFSHWPSHTTSRVHALDTPWPLSPTVSPIPTLFHNEMDFGYVIDKVASEHCRRIESTNKIPYLCWSGGIDSTSILVSMLKNATSEFLRRLVVLYNESSIQENAYFFHKFINKKIQTQSVETFIVDENNYNKIVVLDGECGNQCMSYSGINSLRYLDKMNILNGSAKINSHVLQHVIKFSMANITPFAIDLIRESTKFAPIPIETIYDFIWWSNFNFKFDDVLLRKFDIWTSTLNNAQCAVFWNEGLCRFYADPELQVWSMISKDIRREKTAIFSKYFSKKYIFYFDKNDLYFSNKRESYSSTNFWEKIEPGKSQVFAIDILWNKYNINDPLTRLQLNCLLETYR